MKKIFFTFLCVCFLTFFSAPFFVKADNFIIGQAYIRANTGHGYEPAIVDIYTTVNNPVTKIIVSSSQLFAVDSNNSTQFLYYDNGTVTRQYLYTWESYSVFVPTLTENTSWASGSTYNDIDEYYQSLPEEFRPSEPSFSERLWDSFYDLYELVFGYRPMPGSIFDLLRNGAEGDYSEDTQITFPTLTPTPIPTPTPTPIPVQTIFVPDGNGNTTIIYQYPDPTTGVITQSPYNPNVTNNINVNCDCEGGSGSGTFSSDPQDPYTYDASLFWADGFGVQMSDNPLSAASDSQATLKAAAMEYDSSVQVLSNSFNILPIKWLALVGIAGGILIIAGFIRTFLGG